MFKAKLNELSSVSESNCELEDQLMRMKDEKEEEEKEKTRLKEELQESREKTRLLQAELTQVVFALTFPNSGSSIDLYHTPQGKLKWRI